MLIAQISDMHVKSEGERLYGAIDTFGMLAATLADIERLKPRPDLLVATGDLAADGTTDDYVALRALFEGFPLPYVFLPGNHDIRENLRAAFPEQPWDTDSEFLQIAVDSYPLRFMLLDTVVPGTPGGRLCAERLDWLVERLDEAPDRHTAICMHHPPFVTGISDMDRMGLEDATGLAAVLKDRSHVVRILCGHLHRPIQAALCNIPVSVAPSTCFQVGLRLGAAPGIVLKREPPAYQLHLWDQENGFVTHTAYVGDYGDWIPAQGAGRA